MRLPYLISVFMCHKDLTTETKLFTEHKFVSVNRNYDVS